MLESAVQPQRTEGPVAKAIERQTSRIPSDYFLWAAVGSMALSMILQGANKRERSLFFGQWVPTLLIFGLYNKLVKVAGSDKYDRDAQQSFSS